jgi:hypothetical protein
VTGAGGSRPVVIFGSAADKMSASGGNPDHICSGVTHQRHNLGDGNDEDSAAQQATANR